jgi:hypothetical protein
VAEVFVGLLRADRDGYLANQQDFTAWLGRIPGSFHMIAFSNSPASLTNGDAYGRGGVTRHDGYNPGLATLCRIRP